MTDLMVEATGVTKDYKISRGLFRGKEVLRAVDKVSISVNRGETLAVAVSYTHLTLPTIYSV